MWWRLLSYELRRLISTGTLEIRRAGAPTLRFGSGLPVIAVLVTRSDLARRFLLAPELTLGEAYMEGSLVIENDDLSGLLHIVMKNLEARWRPNTSDWGERASAGLMPLLRRIQQHNPLGRSRRNVAHHYDLPDSLYRLFLDRDLQYSCAYFRRPDDDLDLAQVQKKAHIAAKLLLEPGMSVLDIGCGWGGMALTLARDHGVRVHGITLSTRQYAVATARAREAGLEHRVTFALKDYRTVAGTFDRIVSVGMFEHVGQPQFDMFFARLSDLLTEKGVALLHTIGRAERPGVTGAFVRKYIFPGGYVPALSETMAAIERQGLWTTDIEIWRLHYARTLNLWRSRFEAALRNTPDAVEQRFARMWRYYLCISELSFRYGRQVVFQIQLAKQRDTVPLTRDYLAALPSAASGQRSDVSNDTTAKRWLHGLTP